ncbi:MAG: LuxR C-terminal-related transcriptional regulator [Ktedonobacterales bacterium]
MVSKPAGASGYVIKRTAAADLVAAVRAVARGESFLSPSMIRALVNDFTERHANQSSSSTPPSEPPSSTPVTDYYATLTSREREILQLVGEGNTNQETADRLRVSIKTVQTHRASVMMKLRLRDVTHLVRYTVRRGIVDPEL